MEERGNIILTKTIELDVVRKMGMCPHMYVVRVLTVGGKARQPEKKGTLSRAGERRRW